jgi:dTDP-L-rhamnose 4-epimerase
MKSVLITGGAGFIGSHVADRLIESGYRVRVLDNLCAQVHPSGEFPSYLHPSVEPVRGDVRDPEAVAEALRGIDMVVHLVAAVGVGQSMYEIAHYTSTNNLGTAVLLEALMDHPVERLVVASSMSIYGEGLYRTAAGADVEDCEREVASLRQGVWELYDDDGQPLAPVATPEWKRPCLSSVYALSKYDQERLCLLFGRAYDMATCALRFFNVYGPRQALSNPYTGVLAIFASRLLNGRPPLIFEDGQQRRDFVSVYDIARACELALTRPEAAGQVFNIGSGLDMSIAQVAHRLIRVMNLDGQIEPEITGEYRAGDIRHCYADIAAARDGLGFTPEVTFEAGLSELAFWLEGQTAEDRGPEARAQLAARGLTL